MQIVQAQRRRRVRARLAALADRSILLILLILLHFFVTIAEAVEFRVLDLLWDVAAPLAQGARLQSGLISTSALDCGDPLGVARQRRG